MLAGLILYWVGNRVFGHANRGGHRLISFMAGIASIVFGAIILLAFMRDTQSANRGVIILCPIFWLTGAYLIYMSVRANNRKIEAVVDDMTRGI